MLCLRPSLALRCCKSTAATCSLRRLCSDKGPNSLPPTISLSTGVGVLLLGAVAGGLGSLVGLGGAFIIIPALTGPVGLSPHYAIGTSMAAVLATSVGASASYSKSPTIEEPSSRSDRDTSSSSALLFGIFPQRLGVVDVSAALTIIAFSTLFAVAGARASKRLPEQAVRRAQGALMIALASSVILGDYLKQSSSSENLSSSFVKNKTKEAPKTAPNTHEPAAVVGDIGISDSVSRRVRLALVGTVSGLAAGFFGIGGGAVTVPCLVLLLDFDYRTALATSLVVMVPTAMSGAAVHFFQKTMLMSFALPLSFGTAGGAYFGGNFSKYVDETKLKNLFAITMLTLGLRTFQKAARK